MGATKKYMVSMREEEYAKIPSETRLMFLSSYVKYDDYDKYKDNPTFQKLYKARKKAVKDLDVWKFNQRDKE